MKNWISLILSATILFSLTFFNVHAYNSDTYETSLTVEKFVPDEIPYTFRPYRIRAEFCSGADDQEDRFIKKSWLRVNLLDENANLVEIYKQNRDKERTITTCTYSETQIFELDVTLNGTYIFCGWINNNEIPDYIKRVDITDVEVERPMAELVITETDDQSQGIIATAEVKNLECGENTKVDRCVLVKSIELPPGSWPDSLSPEACNMVYDEWLENRINEWAAEGREIQPENGIYKLTEYGEYMLFIEDTNGRYTRISSSAEEPTPLPSPTSGQIVTVKAPAVSHAGGEIAYGENVIISLPEQGHIAYSINGGDYIYSYESTVTITVTEDMELRVKAWVDYPVEGTEYITPEAVYIYTVNNAVSEYPYSIETLAVTNDAGEMLTEPPADAGFIVDVTLKEIKERDVRDQMFVAVYDKNGKLLSLDYVRCNLAVDSDFSIGFYVPPQDAAIGSIKAFIWSSFDSLEPLAETTELNF